MHRNLKHSLVLGAVLVFSTRAGAVDPVVQIVPEAWKWAHNLGASLVNTAYFSAMNSNNQNANMSQWTMDARTILNIIWASVVYGVANKYESSFMPEQEQLAKKLLAEDPNADVQAIRTSVEQAKWWINFIGSTAPMITLNTNSTMVAARYDETKNAVRDYVDPRDETVATVAGGAMFLLRNVGYFYIIPPLIKPINFWFFKVLPKANGIAEAIHARAPSRILACLAFSLTSVVYQELLISIKNLVNQFLPQPATPLSIARFDDCTRCWFGTNLFGKSGAIGSHLYAGRQAVLEWWRTPSVANEKDEEL